LETEKIIEDTAFNLLKLTVIKLPPDVKDAIKNVKTVTWLQDVDMLEALWVFNVEEFGPSTVAIDSHGNNLFEDVKRKAEESRTKIYEKLGSV